VLFIPVYVNFYNITGIWSWACWWCTF